MNLTINGENVEIADNPPRALLWVLRDELGLTGTKFCCGIGTCGSCTIQVDGEATRACITSISNLKDGARIRTIEGLAEADENGESKMHPIQAAFIEEQVPQCSWCMSGQMMTAVTLLEQNAYPTEQEIVDSMGQNYCSCSCAVCIKNALALAAEKIATPVTEENSPQLITG